MVALALLMLTIAAFGTVTPFIMHRFESSSTASRILVSFAILFPLGFFMGMPFPIGIKLASAREGSPLAWFWGINGAASVCASVLAFVLALTWGISFSFWVGAACYIITLLTIPWLTRRTG